MQESSPSTAPSTRLVPAGVTTLKVLAGFMAVFCLIAGFMASKAARGWNAKTGEFSEPPDKALWVTAGFNLVLGSSLIYCSMLKPVPRNWVVGLIFILLGSVACFPFALMLLLWFQRETKEYFQTYGWRGPPPSTLPPLEPSA